jgi:menaquinone-dependent protoporphyrinogen IX oxidase
MKTIVIYRSKSGYTKTYAEWIAEELKCDLKLDNEISLDELKKYDVIIFGGGLYAVGINGISLIKKNFSLLHNKKIVVWATGSNPGREDELQQIWNHNFTKEQLSSIKTFYLRGGFDYKSLNNGDKFLMSILKIKLKLINQRTEDEQGMLDSYNIPEYHCDKEKIKKLIEYVRECECQI